MAPRSGRRPSTRTFAAIVVAASGLLLPAAPAVAAPSIEDARLALRAQDYEHAADIFRTLAKAGDAEAQYQLAALYRSGNGVQKDHAEAVQWLQRAARKGHAKAQYNLAIMYQRGWGVAEDQDQARTWFKAAASQGDDAARRQLAMMDQTPEPAAEEETAKPAPEPVREQHTAITGDTVKGMPVEDKVSPKVAATTSRQPSKAPSATVAEPAPALTPVQPAEPVQVSMQGSYNGWTPLAMAAWRGKTEAVRALIRQGADVNALDSEGYTALARAVTCGRADSVRVLLQSGARTDIQGPGVRPTLQLAAAQPNAEIA